MPRNDYIGFRVSSEGKRKIDGFARKSKLTVGELLNLAIFEKMKDYGELSEIQKSIIEKKR